MPAEPQKPSKWPTIFSAIALIISFTSIYMQANVQATTDAVVNVFEASSESEVWRANIEVTFINSGNRQSLISNVDILYTPSDNQYAEKCRHDEKTYRSMDLVSVESSFGSDVNLRRMVVPTWGMTPATYNFEAHKEINKLDMAYPYEICVNYEAIGDNGKSFKKQKYIGNYLVYNDRVVPEKIADDLKEPIRIILKKSTINFFQERFLPWGNPTPATPG